MPPQALSVATGALLTPREPNRAVVRASASRVLSGARDAQDGADRQHQEAIDRSLGNLTFAKADLEPDLRTLILREVERAEHVPDFGGVLMLDQIAEAAGHARHLVKAEIIHLLDDRLIRCPALPSEDLGGGYDLIQPTLTTAGQRALREG